MINKIKRMFYGDNLSLDYSLEEFLNSLKQKEIMKINKGFSITDIVIALEESGFIEIDERKLESAIKTGDKSNE